MHVLRIDPEVFMQRILEECQEPKLLADLIKTLGCSYSSAYKYVKILANKNKIIIIPLLKEGTKKFLYKTSTGFELAEIDSRNFYKQLEKPLKSDGEKFVHDIKDHGVVVKQGNRTIVRGFNGYHPSKVERVRSKTYVAGGTLEMI